MKIISSYYIPDIDGISCMYAYSELLARQGEEVSYYIWGEPKIEATIVCDMFNIKLDALKEIPKEENTYIIVDHNSFDQAFVEITKDSIVEIIDHHGLSKDISTYKRCAKVQIDRIGAVATIVAERYKLSGLIPSREAAILLYYGIISNSINLKANITSKRDIEMTKWLKSICKDIDERKIAEIFTKKSVITDDNLRSEMECERCMPTHNKDVLVGQIEICNAEEFIAERSKKMDKIIKEVQEEKHPDYFFIDVVDILNGYSMIYCTIDKSKILVETLFGLKFEGNVARFKGLIQRKEITKGIRDYDGELEF